MHVPGHILHYGRNKTLATLKVNNKSGNSALILEDMSLLRLADHPVEKIRRDGPWSASTAAADDSYAPIGSNEGLLDTLEVRGLPDATGALTEQYKDIDEVQIGEGDNSHEVQSSYKDPVYLSTITGPNLSGVKLDVMHAMASVSVHLSQGHGAKRAFQHYLSLSMFLFNKKDVDAAKQGAAKLFLDQSWGQLLRLHSRRVRKHVRRVVPDGRMLAKRLKVVFELWDNEGCQDRRNPLFRCRQESRVYGDYSGRRWVHFRPS